MLGTEISLMLVTSNQGGWHNKVESESQAQSRMSQTGCRLSPISCQYLHKGAGKDMDICGLPLEHIDQERWQEKKD